MKNDCLNEDILDELKKIASFDSLKSHDSFVCIILSHGGNAQVHGIDNVPINTYDIFDIFSDKKCPPMVNKPKIFILQCCRGSTYLRRKVISSALF